MDNEHNFHISDLSLVCRQLLQLHCYPQGRLTGFLMWPTHEDAVVMYAKFCRARYGLNAYEKVQNRAKELAESGDLDGEKIWSEVAAEIKKNRDIAAA